MTIEHDATEDPPRSTLTVSQAARRAGVTTQTIRNWDRRGLIVSTLGQGKRRIDGASLDRHLHATGRAAADVFARLERLEDSVSRRSGAVDVDVVAQLTAERDHYRAEAARLRDTAVRLNAASRDVYEGVKTLLEVLVEQSEAVSMLLAPSSPAEVLASEQAN